MTHHRELREYDINLPVQLLVKGNDQHNFFNAMLEFLNAENCVQRLIALSPQPQHVDSRRSGCWISPATTGSRGLPPLGSGRRHGRGPNAEPNPEGPECRPAIRRIAPNIIRLMDDDHSLKGRMEVAAMSDEYLLRLIVNAIGKF